MRSSRLAACRRSDGIRPGGSRSALAQRPGRRVDGAITLVELVGQPRRIEVRSGGRIVAQGIHVSTRIVFHQMRGVLPNPEMSDLKRDAGPFDYNPSGPLERLHVDSVPRRRGAWCGRRFAPGADGRVVRVNKRRREITVGLDGRNESYGVENPKLLEKVRVGDRIRFEFEERAGGRKVITAIEWPSGQKGRLLRRRSMGMVPIADDDSGLTLTPIVNYLLLARTSRSSCSPGLERTIGSPTRSRPSRRKIVTGRDVVTAARKAEDPVSGQTFLQPGCSAPPSPCT